MTNRIRRTFIAALAATAVTASMGIGASQSAAAGCEYKIWKITKRENVTCKKAKKVLKNDPRVGGGEGTKGWSCSYGKSILPEGKCKKGSSKSFKYSEK
jgi:hypothetical protein